MHEPLITVIGNVAQTPTLRTTAAGVSVAGFRIAATPRCKHRETDEWIDGETLWFGVSAWRQLGEHCASSISKGDRVVVTGRLLLRTWVDAEGKDRTSLQVDATTVGLDLSRSAARVVRPAAPVLDSDPGPLAGLLDQRTGETYGGPLSDAQLEDLPETDLPETDLPETEPHAA